VQFGLSLFCLVVAVLSVVPGGHFVRAIPPLIVALLIFIFWPLYYRKLFVRGNLRIYREGSNRTVFGRFTARIEEDVLIYSSKWHETRYQWPAFEQAVFTDTHTFLLLSPVQAVIIPKAAVVEGDYDAFVAALKPHLPPHPSPGPQSDQFVLSA
jgi:hypothetical protein